MSDENARKAEPPDAPAGDALRAAQEESFPPAVLDLAREDVIMLASYFGSDGHSAACVEQFKRAVDALVAAARAEGAAPFLLALDRVGISPPENEGEPWTVTTDEPEPCDVGDGLDDAIRQTARILMSEELAAARAEGAAEEREACAKFAERVKTFTYDQQCLADHIAIGIRARSPSSGTEAP